MNNEQYISPNLPNFPDSPLTQHGHPMEKGSDGQCWCVFMNLQISPQSEKPDHSNNIWPQCLQQVQFWQFLGKFGKFDKLSKCVLYQESQVNHWSWFYLASHSGLQICILLPQGQKLLIGAKLPRIGLFTFKSTT